MKKILVVSILVLAATAAFAQDITLPAPASRSGSDLLAAMANRRVSRTFVKKDIPPADLATILWSALGARASDAVSSATKANRTVSFSGDNAYLNLYFLSAKGAWKYLPETGALKSLSRDDLRAAISPAAIPAASGMILFVLDTARTPSFLKSNPTLFLQMGHATAGFAAQNIALVASTLKLATIVQYTLKAPAAAESLGLSKDEVPLFVQQIGYTE